MSNAPIAISKEQLDGKNLESMPLWPGDIIKQGVESHKSGPLFGGQFVVMVYEGEDGLLEFSDYPFDEYCYVLNGTSVLTAEGGEPQTFTTGDHFVVPKGFTGTWELKDSFRELIIMEAGAAAEGMKIFGFA